MDYQAQLSEAFAARRTASPTRVEFMLTGADLSEVARARALEKRLASFADSSWLFTMATPLAWKKLPHDQGGLYLFTWEPPFLLRTEDHVANRPFHFPLYVGRTGGPESPESFKSRYRREYAGMVQHSTSKLWSGSFDTRRQRLEVLLSLDRVLFWYHPLSSYEAIADLEAELISLFTPPGNKQKPQGRGRLGPPQPAF